MERLEALAEMKSRHGIEQTPPDWLNEFDTRGEAYNAWIASRVDSLPSLDDGNVTCYFFSADEYERAAAELAASFRADRANHVDVD